VKSRRDARVTLIGVGGLGTPVALALARAGVGTLRLLDDDVVDRTNLHRQILFRDADVGRSKLEAARDALVRAAPGMRIELHEGRLHPGSIDALEDADVIVECSDRYAVKFLAADAARILGKPIVHGAAIRWIGTAMATGPKGSPCYRCIFEEIPDGAQSSCDVSGVVGPVCGVIGALEAHLALRILDGAEPWGTLASFDGRSDVLRMRRISPRKSCPLCGTPPTIDRIEPSRYVARRAPEAPCPDSI
jgi:molybdopterin/thiamine biosynthesis adenylyltransferase